MNRVVTAAILAVAVAVATLGALELYRRHGVVQLEPEPIKHLKRGVQVTTSAVFVDEVKVVGLLSFEEQARAGVEARFKLHGPNDLLIVPLQSALSQRAFSATEKESGLGIELASEAPFRVMMEVLYTVGQAGPSKLRLSVPPSGSKRALLLETELPRDVGSGQSAKFYVIRDGVSVKFQNRNVAPGCEGFGNGVAVPKRDGHDLPALVACLHRLNSDPSTAANEGMVTANPGTTARTVLEVASAVRCGEPSCDGRQLGLPFVQRVVFGIPR